MRFSRQIFILLIVILINILIVFGVLNLSENFKELGYDFFNNNKFFLLLLILTSILLVNFFGVLNLYKNTRSNYSVAIIGFPRSGKTTILMTLFDQILSQRIKRFQARIQSGSGTIERVAEGINKIRKLQQIPPTEDQDVYAYRTLITKGRGIFSREFRVEFGDFPGEQSREFVEKYDGWFHRTPYFQWVKEANAFIFVIDCGIYLAEKVIDKNEYIQDITTSFLAAWQHLLDANPDLRNFTRRYPVLVIFNKSDLIYNFIIGKQIQIDLDSDINFKEFFREYILNFGLNKIPRSTLPKELYIRLTKEIHEIFSDLNVYPSIKNIPLFIEDDKYFYLRTEKVKRMIEDDFKDILNHFKGQSKNFNHSFVSSFEKDEKLKQKNFERILSQVIDTPASNIL